MVEISKPCVPPQCGKPSSRRSAWIIEDVQSDELPDASSDDTCEDALEPFVDQVCIEYKSGWEPCMRQSDVRASPEQIGEGYAGADPSDSNPESDSGPSSSDEPSSSLPHGTSSEPHELHERQYRQRQQAVGPPPVGQPGLERRNEMDDEDFWRAEVTPRTLPSNAPLNIPSSQQDHEPHLRWSRNGSAPSCSKVALDGQQSATPLQEEADALPVLPASTSPESPVSSRSSSCTVVCCTVPDRAVPCRAVPYRTGPDRTEPFRTVPYRTAPHHIVPYRTVPYRTAPRRTVPSD